MMTKLEKPLLILFFLLGSGKVQFEVEGGPFSEPESLYGPQDHVVILNATNIKQNIYGTSNGWIVEFYSSWCGHCINFAPIYKQFAEEVEGWQSVVKVAGIDCADEKNIATCRNYEIMGYPTILFFRPYSRENKTDVEGKSELNRGEQFPRSEKVSDLKHNLMDIVKPHFPSVLGEVPVSTVSTLTTFNAVWKYVNSVKSPFGTSPSLVILLFETEKSFIGKEVALLLSSYPAVRVLRFSKKNFLYERLGIKDDWPAAGYLKQNLQTGIIPIPKNKDIVLGLQSAILKIIKAEGIKSSNLGAPAPQIAIAESNREAEKEADRKQESNLEEPASSNDVVSLEDLIHAVRNSLRNEVGVLKVIPGSKLKVLKQYVHMLSQLFPADRRDLIVFLMKLEKWLEPWEDAIPVNEYLDKLTELEVELHPWDIDVNTWGNCKGTVPGRRGYTCTLWRLFHTLTILASQKSEEMFVLPVIHGYVKEFFGCTDCVKHFMTMVADEGPLMITSVKGQALWLWKAHNKVNLRLKGAQSEDPGFPKLQYPTQTQCSSCHTSDDSFDEEKVFEYLIKVYTNPTRIQQPIKNKSYRDPYAQSLSQNHHSHSQIASRFFSGADYWLFCMVYLSVAALLIFCYVHFKFGSRRRFDPLMLCRKALHTSRSIV